jgi:hypothetical protein
MVTQQAATAQVPRTDAGGGIELDTSTVWHRPHARWRTILRAGSDDGQGLDLMLRGAAALAKLQATIAGAQSARSSPCTGLRAASLPAAAVPPSNRYRTTNEER